MSHACCGTLVMITTPIEDIPISWRAIKPHQLPLSADERCGYDFNFTHCNVCTFRHDVVDVILAGRFG
eukprot:32044-Eustigmatos_ZCMA.PRE.1